MTKDINQSGATPPPAQGPEGNGHDLPSCRACGFPGSDDHEDCPNCGPDHPDTISAGKADTRGPRAIATLPSAAGKSISFIKPAAVGKSEAAIRNAERNRIIARSKGVTDDLVNVEFGGDD